MPNRREVRKKVLARSLEIISDETEPQQEHTEVVAGACGLQCWRRLRGRSTVQAWAATARKLDVCLDLAEVQRALEPAELTVPRYHTL